MDGVVVVVQSVGVCPVPARLEPALAPEPWLRSGKLGLLSVGESLGVEGLGVGDMLLLLAGLVFL